ncbi:hypothetical protein CLAFUW4_13864 [Fulvia fulva]|uniref:Uncharacterized protein n=1 Tax=Passalora fulva TaxID=5499 RepID=A0A9Q8PLW0_PASFU|nr:uncharacterized protein CLAFUR5_13709 [Fulvia fulva]KAK4610193.1 hypothetical protein CLAFUR4_13867 [Fulvia fulva]KAK4611333.1 hypothetical protein CLAFUR0_13871 [Fulvia fulva]UJO24827.1 hypothetical protein CLAFUR5_13709 [Fulvia fulva]WPV22032.1 hypothetical protein CLAFUW4_13864 [Fulvia fulva]WPV37014.1 hypothetical protein CLAFUW7_13872 [Fulvia fulva]
MNVRGSTDLLRQVTRVLTPEPQSSSLAGVHVIIWPCIDVGGEDNQVFHSVTFTSAAKWVDNRSIMKLVIFRAWRSVTFSRQTVFTVDEQTLYLATVRSMPSYSFTTSPTSNISAHNTTNRIPPFASMSNLSNQWILNGYPVADNSVVRQDPNYVPFQSCFGGPNAPLNSYPFQSSGQGGYSADPWNGARPANSIPWQRYDYAPGQGFYHAAYQPGPPSYR